MCCHVSPVKSRWHSPSVLNQQLSTRDPLIFYFNLYICSLFLCGCRCHSRFPRLPCFLLRRLTIWFPPPAVSSLLLFLFVHPCAQGHTTVFVQCVDGLVKNSGVLVMTHWTWCHIESDCVCLGVSERIRVLPLSGWSAGHCRPTGCCACQVR